MDWFELEQHGFLLVKNYHTTNRNLSGFEKGFGWDKTSYCQIPKGTEVAVYKTPDGNYIAVTEINGKVIISENQRS